MGQGRFLFPHGFSLELEPVSVVYEPVHDGIGEGRVSEHLMPVCDGKLGGHHGGMIAISVLHHFQDVIGLSLCELISQPVIQDEKLGPGQLVQELRIGTIRPGEL